MHDVRKKALKKQQKAVPEICYLNTDLDLVSRQPFDKLVRRFRHSRWIELRYLEDKDKSGRRVWSGWFEASMGDETPQETINRFLRVLENLQPGELQEWRRCDSKIFNIGYDCGDHPWGFANALSARSLERIGRLGAGLEITIYPAERYRSVK